jgi:hypothetical protein
MGSTDVRDGLTLGTPEAMSRAYVYAFLAFLASVAKVSSPPWTLIDLSIGLHRSTPSLARTTSHCQNEVRAHGKCQQGFTADEQAAIYDKALRRKDASGVIASREKIEDVKDGEKEEKKANADSGKIVNLMASQ